MITCQMISETVSGHYRLPIRELYSQRRQTELVTARQMAWRLARDLTGRSFPEIARAMGNRDHSTVMHGIRAIEHKMRSDPKLVDQAKALLLDLSTKDIASNVAAQIPPLAPHDLDPVSIAETLLRAPLDDVVAAETARCLGIGVLVFSKELEQARGRIAMHAGLRRLAQDVAIAAAAFENALSGRNEKAARTDLNKTLNALRNHFAKEKSHV